jgi:tetratricopeptide (TPR) repeat protein
MGLLSWFFPSPEDRAARGRKFMAAGRPDEARLEVLDVEHPEAKAVLKEAENALAVLNLEAAVDACRAQDDVRAGELLELADRFHSGGHEERFKEARREMRELRAERSAAEVRKKEDEQRRMLSVDPLGVSGGPSWLDKPVDDSVFGPEREELEARLALAVENYPESLRASVSELGPTFGQAVLDLDDGRPDLAIQGLVALSDDEPLVQWERARAAYAVGDPAAAAKALRRFASLAGHHAIGQRHTAVFLAQCMAESGDVPGALAVMRSAREDEPKLAGLFMATLLEATGELPEAEKVLKEFVREQPRVAAGYVSLARVRVKGGYRKEAMAALEAQLSATHCTPGKCGFQPPDLEVHRMLATLYLEDGIERERALELAGTAQGLVQKPAWPDLYLAALMAKAQGRPETRQLVDRLREVTPEGSEEAKRIAML